MNRLAKKIVYGLSCIGVFLLDIILCRLIFGTGNVIVVLFILPALPFLCVGLCLLVGVFDDFLGDKDE